MSVAILVLDKVSRIHGSGEATVHALSRVSLSVRPGELVAVMGPSGSGKSTLLNLAGALDLPSSGRVLIDGTDLTTLSTNGLAAIRRRRVGFVFQDFNLVPSLNAIENVTVPLELDGVGVKAAREQGMAALELVHMTRLADRFPDQLSGGQRQRVAIARAVTGDRRLVLADEPTGALDSQTSDAVLEVLRERCDSGAGGLLVTHESRHAAWADRVVFLRDGVLVDTTQPATSAEQLLDLGV